MTNGQFSRIMRTSNKGKGWQRRGKGEGGSKGVELGGEWFKHQMQLLKAQFC
jgi:hypothetical protein